MRGNPPHLDLCHTASRFNELKCMHDTTGWVNVETKNICSAIMEEYTKFGIAEWRVFCVFIYEKLNLHYKCNE